MSVLAKLSIVISSYVAMGRTGAIATCLFFEAGVVMTIVMALLLDLVQIPVYGLLLEASSHKDMPFGQKVSGWIERRRNKLNTKMSGSKFWSRITHIKPLAIIAVSTIPIRGCGIISACILTFILGYGRIQGTILIMAGSIIGALATLAVLYQPIRLLYGF